MLSGRIGRRQGTVPSFLVIGTRRGGSTSLYEWIIRHPNVAPSKMKKGSHYFDVNHRRGWRWFRSCFPVLPEGMVTGEASPYYMFHPLAPLRIARELPGVRLIAVLREPVARAYSQYQFERRNGFENLSFDEAVDREDVRLSGERERMLARPGYESFTYRHHSYLARGRYREQLDRLAELFPAERILVLQSEALFADPAAQLARVWGFLGLAPLPPTDLPAYKQARYEAIPETTRGRLVEYFRPHNERLYALPGIDFRWPATIGSPAPGPGPVTGSAR